MTRAAGKLFHHLMGPILARALHGAVLIRIHLFPFLTVVNFVCDLPEGWGAGAYSSYRR